VADTAVGAPAKAVLHDVDEGVMTLVTVPAPEYARDMDEVALLQMLETSSVVVLSKSWYRAGDDIVILEPEAKMTDKVALSLTTSDCTTGLVPLTFKV
jgi:hypothetical protein